MAPPPIELLASAMLEAVVQPIDNRNDNDKEAYDMAWQPLTIIQREKGRGKLRKVLQVAGAGGGMRAENGKYLLTYGR